MTRIMREGTPTMAATTTTIAKPRIRILGNARHRVESTSRPGVGHQVDVLRLKCGCTAGQHGRRCRHQSSPSSTTTGAAGKPPDQHHQQPPPSEARVLESDPRGQAVGLPVASVGHSLPSAGMAALQDAF